MSVRRVALACSLVLGACAPPATELIVVIDSNLIVPDEADEIVVIVTGPAGVATEVRQTLVGADAGELPLTLAVIPADPSRLGTVSIHAEAQVRGGRILAAERITTLRAGESTTLPLLLLRGCVNRMCADTCGELGCERAAVEPADLETWTGEAMPFESSDPCVNNRWDSDGDNFGARECGGLDCDDDVMSTHINARERCGDRVDNDCDDATDETDCE